MELTFAWFWVVNTIAFIITVGVAYKAIFSCRFASPFWNTVAAIVIILAIISPIKLDGTGSTQYKSKQTYNIKQAKELPPKAKAKDWKKIYVDGITEEDLK